MLQTYGRVFFLFSVYLEWCSLNKSIFFSQIPIGPGFATNALVLTCIAILIYIRIRTRYWYNGENVYTLIKFAFVPVMIGLILILLGQFISTYPYHILVPISTFLCLFSISIIIPMIMIFGFPSMKLKLFVKAEELYSIFV